MAQKISYLLYFQFTLLTPIHRDFTAARIHLKKQVSLYEMNHKDIPTPLPMTFVAVVL